MNRFSFTRKQPRQVLKHSRGREGLERAHPDPATLFQTTRKQAIERGDKLIQALSEDLKNGGRESLETYWQRLPFLFDVVQTTHEATRLLRENQLPKPLPAGLSPEREGGQEEESVPTFLVSSLFLSVCAAYLTSSPRGHERLHLVTGMKLSPTSRTLERMVNVALESESAIHAQANQQELQKALIEMDEWGHHLYGLFHSHPGKGAHATQPSGTDLKTHERYESGGYPLIGAIFVKDGSTDGFISRFFANCPFSIAVYGKGIEKIEENENDYVYKINAVHSNLQLQAS